MKSILDRLDHILGERPLGCACLLFMLVSPCLLFAPTLFKILLFAFSAAAAAVLIALRNKSFFARFHLVRAVVCFAVSALACLSCFLSYDLFDRRFEKAANENAVVKTALYLDGVVYESDFSSVYTASVRRADDRAMPGVKALVRFSKAHPDLFTLYEGAAQLSPPTGSTQGYDVLSYYRSKGIFAEIVNGDELSDTSERVYVPARLFHALREEIVRCIDGFTDKNTAALLTALLTGDRSRLSDALTRDFGTLGVSHLLAVSGLHLSVLFFFADKLLKKLFLPLKARAPIEILFIVLFMGVCAFSPSVTRAGIMLILFVLSSLAGEKSDGFTSLLLAGAVMTFFAPFTVFNTGFLLSFFAAFGILFLSKMKSRKKRRLPRVLSYILDALAVSLAAQIAVLPVTLITFGTFSILAPFSTLILSLPVTLILYLAPVCLLLSLIPFLSSACSAAITLPCNLTVKLSSYARYFKAFFVKVQPLPALLFILLIAFSFLWIVLVRKRKAPFVLMIAGYVCVCVYSFFAPRFLPARVWTAASGGSDVLLVRGEGRCTIIDQSDGSKQYFRRCIDLLQQNTEILFPDTLILTHTHMRHLGGVEYLFENTYLDQLLLPEPAEDEKEIYLSLASKAEKAGVSVYIYRAEDRFELTCGVTFSGFEKAAVKHSTHPVFSFCLSRGGVSRRYLSFAAWEVFDLSGNEALYFCAHGPKAAEMPDRRDLSGRSIFCADGELYRYFFGEEQEEKAYYIFDFETQ